MAGSDYLTGQNIQDTYQRVLQISSSGEIADGTGSLYVPPTASHAITALTEITKEVSSSYAETSSHAVLAANATLATVATIAGTSTISTVNANNTENAYLYLTFVDGNSGGQGIEVDSGLTYNPLINHVKADFFGTGFGWISGSSFSAGGTDRGTFLGTAFHADGDEVYTTGVITGSTVRSSGAISASGAITASNLRGTNTGDQDLTGYALKANNVTNQLTASFAITASDVTFDDLTLTGNISSSKTTGTKILGTDLVVHGKISSKGSDVTIGEGSITCSGDITSSGTINMTTGSFNHIITDGDSIEFRNASSGGSEGKLSFTADGGLAVKDASNAFSKVKAGYVTSTITLVSDADTQLLGPVTASGIISQSGANNYIHTNQLKGGNDGNSGGSLTLTGSLTYMDLGGAKPAISESTFYVNDFHPMFQSAIIDNCHPSSVDKGWGAIKILPTGWDNNDDTSYQRIVYEDDSNIYGIRPGSTSHELYKAIDIPSGWKVIKYIVYSSQARPVNFIVVNITTGVGSTDATSGNANSLLTLTSPMTGTDLNYALLKYDPVSTADTIYGGVIYMQRV